MITMITMATIITMVRITAHCNHHLLSLHSIVIIVTMIGMARMIAEVMMLLPQFKFLEKKKLYILAKKHFLVYFSQFRLLIVGQCYKFYNWHTTGISDLQYQLPICCKSENLERPLHLDQEQLVFVRPQATRYNSSQNIKWKLWETRRHFAKQRLSQNIS